MSAISRQAGELLFDRTAATVPVREQAAEALLAFAKFYGAAAPLHSIFFCNTGSEATKNALKIAAKITGRFRFAAFAGGWHGRGILPLSVTDDPKIAQPYGARPGELRAPAVE